MARYDRFHRDRYDQGARTGGYGRFDRPAGPWGGGSAGRRARGGPYPGGWDDEGWREGRGRGGPPGGYPDVQRPRAWEAGQPWGGESDADRVRAGDIMTRNPEAVTSDTPLQEVAARMRELDVGIIPVVDDLERYRLRGVITDRDIAIRAAAEGKDMAKATAGDHMTADVETVGENDHVRDVFSVMKRERVRRVPVTDDAGRLVGIIAQADLAVDYAGLDLQRETEVEEVLERISEPGPYAGRARGARPWSARYVQGGPVYDRAYRHDRDMGDWLRHGWRTVKREARELLGREGYDRGWR